MANRVSVRATRRAELSAEKARAKSSNGNGHHRTTDSFQNLSAKIGINADNLSAGGTYGFNPITRQRTLLEWIHRGSWIAGLAVDIIPDDMTRNGVEIVGDMSPDEQERSRKRLRSSTCGETCAIRPRGRVSTVVR